MVYRFLIVDDTQFMRKMASDSLKQFDYEVAGEAINGREAVEKYKELKPDIVLMDLTMPEMNGIDAIKKILESDPAAVILVCSSSNQKDMIEEALKSGAKGYLTKPFKPEYMEEVIQKHALPHVAAAKKAIPAAASEVEPEPVKSAELVEPVAPVTPVAPKAAAIIEKPASAAQKQATFSNFIMSSMCSWREELEGASSSYTVTCTDQENKLVIEWMGNNQEKQSIRFSIQGFQQLAGWLDQQVLAGRG